MEHLYKIGAVSKRTGITPECLRAWERRYGLVPAERAGKTRFYSTEQVEWLQAIKSLLDQGHPIGQIIHFDSDEITRRLRSAQTLPQSSEQAARVGVVGAELAEAYRTARRTGATAFEAVQWADIDELSADPDPPPKLDCMVIHLSSLDIQRIDVVRQIYGSAHLAATYSYAKADDYERFEAIGCALLKWPAPWQQLERTIEELLQRPLYSARQLIAIREGAEKAGCEWSLELVRFIRELNHFAVHAKRGDSDRDEDQAQLGEGVQNARKQLERSLQPLVEKYELLTERTAPILN